MKLGVNLVYSGAAEIAREAEILEYELCLAPEGFRSDAVSVLGLVAGCTTRISIGSAVMQIPARPPATTALTAATLNAISDGRFRLGLGVSNSDVSRGWYNVPFEDPISRTREYIQIVRKSLYGEPTVYKGKYYSLPGVETPLRITTEPSAHDLPIYLAASGPRNLALAGEICDGWIGVFVEPDDVRLAIDKIGAAREYRNMAGFGAVPCIPASIGDSLSECIDSLRLHYSLMMGVGDVSKNFYCKLASSKGFKEAAEATNRYVRRGQLRKAMASVPAEFIERTALVGGVNRVAERMEEYADAGANVLSIMASALDSDLSGRLVLLESASEALSRSGVMA